MFQSSMYTLYHMNQDKHIYLFKHLIFFMAQTGKILSSISPSLFLK